VQTRLAAASVLQGVREGGSLSRELPKVLAKTPPDTHPTIQALVYGVLRQYERIDALLALLLRKPLKRKAIDASLEDEVLKRTEEVIQSVDGVVNMHLLRTRKSGGNAFADVHIQVPSRISVSEGHQIAEAVRKAIVDKIDEITDVTILTDPEDDAIAKPNDHLPLRDEVVGLLRRKWLALDLYNDIENINLHYLDWRIDVDVYLPLKWAENPGGILDEMVRLGESLGYIDKVNVFFTRA
jgi:hypothetical protein